MTSSKMLLLVKFKSLVRAYFLMRWSWNK